MMTSIHGVEDIIGYHFTNPSMIWEALQAAGSPVYVIGNRRLVDGNKRLALLGDTVLQLALAETWLDANEPRARFDQIRLEVGSNPNLDRIGRETGLVAFVSKNPSQGNAVSFATMTATVEAVIGAVYLDGDMTAVKRIMGTLGLAPV